MTPKEAIKRLKELQTVKDRESACIDADEIAAEMLREAGFERVAKAFEKIDVFWP